MKRRHGAVLVELALVIPIVLLLVAAFLELSRVAMLKHSADSAAYEGARIGIMPGAQPAAAIQGAKELLLSAKIKNAQVAISPTTIEEETPFVTVKVSIPISTNSWISPFFFKNGDISSSVSLITERPAAVQLSGLDGSNSGLGVSALGIGL
ncbi:MAG: TadE family protein [Pirellulaceae bacterium]|nr:TadE family protein [Pirellulaceae bacterium]